ncbi:MAG: 3-deoxy-7-phosphoheptulonate synthase class II [Planctomycetota bacterium]|nr:3-deoxy-7-phosphoheptulonate synthase class II [Planctomycetota bacterium]
MNDHWTPSSWQKKIVTQQPVYPDRVELDETLRHLAKLPPLVTSWEIENLKGQLAEAAAGKAFLIQAGDCSESLEDCETDAIVRNLKVLIQMSFILIFGSMKKVIRVGRIAGQYAKPRSADTETREGVTLPVYRGDIVNRSGFSEADRQPDPQLLLRGYERAALTLNFIRGLLGGGFADLHHPENWDLDFASESPRAQQYHRMVNSINESMHFMEAILGSTLRESQAVEIFTSHEGLHLSYEQAQTRHVPRREGWYNLSTHFPWIGFRTRAIDGAHVEYFRGIVNPVGIKVGPGMEPGELLRLVEMLNPENEAGKITLIHRFGAEQIGECLAPLIQAVNEQGCRVLWTCDPMHGNTYSTNSGIKTRNFDQIISELKQAFQIHQANESILGGVHLEMTGDNVTECVGGAGKLAEPDLHRAYKSTVDPRLNYDQAIELAFTIAEQMKTDQG